MAYAIDGMEGNDTAAIKIIHNYWNYFTAGWRRTNPAILTSITESVTNVCLFCCSLNSFQLRMLISNKFIYGLLAEKMKLPAKKRLTKFVNKGISKTHWGRSGSEQGTLAPSRSELLFYAKVLRVLGTGNFLHTTPPGS